MKSNEKGKVLTCFGSMQQQIFAFSYNPDNNFEFVIYTNIQTVDNKDAIYVKTAINYKKTKTLICYTVQSSNMIKCIY